MTEKKPLILVADDEEHMLMLLTEVLRRWGYEVVTAENGGQVLKIIEERQIDLVILDIKMPRLSGLEILKRLRQRKKKHVVVMLTAYATVRTAVEAIKMGAFDYLTKPFQMDELQAVILNGLEISRLSRENDELRLELQVSEKLKDFIGYSPVMQDVLQKLGKVAPTDFSVLITGESGTGKSRLAKLIHETSRRADKRFIGVNCAGIPENLIESELFGHERGAFTGAVQRRLGKFELATEGTLFLDEISTLALPMQAKLLQILQEQEFERVGGSETIKVDTRVIAATNQNLKKLVEKGLFREDLYFRLNVVPLELPKLRERKEDIPLLVSYFLNKYNKKQGVTPKKISQGALQLLVGYHWPGNVREVENVIKQVLVMAEGKEIKPEDLPEQIRGNKGYALSSRVAQEESLDEILQEVEREIIISTLRSCNWQRSLTARRLKISRRSLYNKLDKLNIEPEREKEGRQEGIIKF